MSEFLREYVVSRTKGDGLGFSVAVPGHRFAGVWSANGEDLLLRGQDGRELIAGASWSTFDLRGGMVMSRVQWAGMPRGARPSRSDAVPSWVFAWDADCSRVYGGISSLLWAEEMETMMADFLEMERLLSDSHVGEGGAAVVLGLIAIKLHRGD